MSISSTEFTQFFTRLYSSSVFEKSNVNKHNYNYSSILITSIEITKKLSAISIETEYFSKLPVPVINANVACGYIVVTFGNSMYPRECRFGSKVGQISPNGTNPGLFQIRFQYIIKLIEPNVLKSDLKKSRICPICGLI